VSEYRVNAQKSTKASLNVASHFPQ